MVLTVALRNTRVPAARAISRVDRGSALADIPALSPSAQAALQRGRDQRGQRGRGLGLPLVLAALGQRGRPPRPQGADLLLVDAAQSPRAFGTVEAKGLLQLVAVAVGDGITEPAKRDQGAPP